MDRIKRVWPLWYCSEVVCVGDSFIWGLSMCLLPLTLSEELVLFIVSSSFFLVNPSVLFYIICSGRLLQSSCLSSFLLLIKKSKQQHRQVFLFLDCCGRIEILLLQRNVLNLLCRLHFPSHSVVLRSLSEFFLSHLPFGIEFLKKEEKIIKGIALDLSLVSFVFLWTLFLKICAFSCI